jgi:spore coat protein JB
MNNYQTYHNSNYLKGNNANVQNTTGNLYDPYAGFIRGNMFPNLYDPYKIPKPYDIQPVNEQAQLLTYIDSLGFAMIDLNLYLDVHPDDRGAIDLFNQYRTQKNELKQEYERKFGPLLLSSDALATYPWPWDDKPWPWENK